MAAPHTRTHGTVAFAMAAGVIIGGPLLGMMGFVLAATATLLLVVSPLLLLFSPILVPAVILLVGSMAAFGTAAAMAIAGLSALSWAFRAVGGAVPGIGRVRESAERVKGQGMEFGGYLQQKGQQDHQPHQNRVAMPRSLT